MLGREAGTRRIHFDQTVIQNGTNSCRVTAIKTCILYVTIPKVCHRIDYTEAWVLEVQTSGWHRLCLRLEPFTKKSLMGNIIITS